MFLTLSTFDQKVLYAPLNFTGQSETWFLWDSSERETVAGGSVPCIYRLFDSLVVRLGGSAVSYSNLLTHQPLVTMLHRLTWALC